MWSFAVYSFYCHCAGNGGWLIGDNEVILINKTMIKQTLLLAVSMAFALGTYAQNRGVGVDSNLQGCDYIEPDDNTTANATEWNKLEDKLYVTWASHDVQYKKRTVPSVTQSISTSIKVWKGERASLEALLYSKTATEKLALKADMGTSTIGCEPRFMNWVLTDQKVGCGTNPMNTTAYLVADIIDIETTKAIDARTVRPVWVTLEIPRDIEAGTYDVAINVLKASDNSVQGTLNLTIKVCDYTLPEAKDQNFYLNFWQQPYAISRYYGVTNWSEEHMNALRPYLKMMARAGQKAISTILFYEPWGDQSNDKFEAMIKSTKKNDGTWTYDYTDFDKWVELNMECGITEEIHCFSMIPWDMNFVYYDESGRQQETGRLSTGTTSYNEFWTKFLKAFAQHLTEKGWLDKTYMALDERSSGDVQNVYNLMQNLNLGFKLSLAGAYHSNLVSKLEDYCLEEPSSSWNSSDIQSRRNKGYRSTIYTCCSSETTNIIANSAPADGAFLPIYAIANDCDGYLHWSWCNWTDEPLKDSRFKYWGGGDCYVVYPGARSGVRFERVIEGVQLAEKVRLLREAYTTAGNTTDLTELNNKVAEFTNFNPSSTASLVTSLQKIVNVFQEEGEYCEPQISATASKIQSRWLKTVTSTGAVANLDYTAASASADGYVLCTEDIKVNPGQTFQIRLVPCTDGDGLQFCRLGAFTDWDCNKEFEAEGSVYGDATPNNQTGNTSLLDLTLTITVPDDAKPGDSRIRLVYNDAWVDIPTACGELTYGFVFDIPIFVIDRRVTYLDEDNTEVSQIRNQQDNTRHLLLLRRNLTADLWSSIILPFSLEREDVLKAFGKDVVLAKLDAMEKTNDGGVIKFLKVDISDETPVIAAGKPYIIKPSADMATLADGTHSYMRIDNSKSGGYEKMEITVTDGQPVIFEFPNVLFNNIYIDDTGIEAENHDGLLFKGSYIKKTEDGLVPAGSFVLSAATGRWHHTTSPINTIRGFRSWIDTSGLSAGSKISFSIDGIDDGDVTAIGFITCEGAETVKNVYTIDGRKVRVGKSLDSLAKGVYIVDGRKIVVR